MSGATSSCTRSLARAARDLGLALAYGARALALALSWAGLFASAACHKSATSTPAPECTTRADCVGGLAGGLLCTEGKCVGCERSRDCRITEVCDPVQRRCTLKPCFGDACVAHTDCAVGQFCVQGLCLDPAATGACTVRLCGADRDCNAGERCNQRTFVCETDLGCAAGSPCATGQVCNEASGVCVPGCTDETAEAVCGPLVPCLANRCVQCAQDSDCGPGLTCNVSAGSCQGATQCLSTRDCPVPQVCDAPTGTCASTRPPCTSNESCATDERCSTTTGTCVTGACLPDRFTPNQSADTAALLAPGTYTALTLCDGGSDYYALNLNSGDRVQVVSDTDPLGSFDLQLYTPLGALLAEAPTALLATAGTTGKYVLVAATHDASALYALRIDVRAGTACQHSPPDVHPQPNLALALGDGRHLDYAVCPGEETWFVARTPGGVSFDAALDPTQGGPIVLELYDSNTTTLLARDASGAAALHVEAASSLGGEFFLRVVGASKVTSNRYDLTLRWLGALP